MVVLYRFIFSIQLMHSPLPVVASTQSASLPQWMHPLLRARQSLQYRFGFWVCMGWPHSVHVFLASIVGGIRGLVEKSSGGCVLVQELLEEFFVLLFVCVECVDECCEEFVAFFGVEVEEDHSFVRVCFSELL